MGDGIRIELEISGDGCNVVEVAEQKETNAKSINWARTNGDGTVTEEVVFSDGVQAEDVPLERVIEHEDYSVFQFEREQGCACEQIERELDRPVSDIDVRNGSIVMTFHVNDLSELKGVIETLRERFNDVRVNRIIKPDTDIVEDRVSIDRRKLTDRQLEVLQKAQEMGYFTHPREVNAGDIADELDIAISTFSEHLAAAEAKLTEDLFSQ